MAKDAGLALESAGMAAIRHCCSLGRHKGCRQSVAPCRSAWRPGGSSFLTASWRACTIGPSAEATDPRLSWAWAEAYGFRGEVWTCRRIAKVLAQEFGISYSRSQVSRLLKELAWTPQVPLTQALQRDEQAIQR